VGAANDYLTAFPSLSRIFQRATFPHRTKRILIQSNQRTSSAFLVNRYNIKSHRTILYMPLRQKSSRGPSHQILLFGSH
jgi:hypothetical protein